MSYVAVVTTSRADYGVYGPVLRALATDAGFTLRLLVSGSHLSPDFGMTTREIEADGFAISERIEVLLASDSPEGTAKSMGLGLIGFGQCFSRSRPDLLVVLGDRFEMYAAALAALPFRIPVAHIHGGEVTVGAMDEALRHSMTKLSHLHFVSTEEYAWRVMQLGEEAWRVTICGAPSLDNIRTVAPRTQLQLEEELGFALGARFLLVTFHPATLEGSDPGAQAETLLAAVEATGLPAVVTMPNADPGGRSVRAAIRRRAAHPRLHAVESLGTQGYFGLMAHASAMVGNSSSGIVEAASFGLPVVNVGERQLGRVRATNVIDARCEAGALASAIDRALDPVFRASLQGLPNPYGDGHAAERIVSRLKQVDFGSALLLKRFADMPR